MHPAPHAPPPPCNKFEAYKSLFYSNLWERIRLVVPGFQFFGVFLFIFRVDLRLALFIYFYLPRGFVQLIQVTFCKYLLFVKSLRTWYFRMLTLKYPCSKFIYFCSSSNFWPWHGGSALLTILLNLRTTLLKRTPQWSHHKVLYIIVIIIHHYLSYLLKARTNFWLVYFLYVQEDSHLISKPLQI
jgi:hypothetical protein